MYIRWDRNTEEMAQRLLPKAPRDEWDLERCKPEDQLRTEEWLVVGWEICLAEVTET
jgi:hypothetical protein